jgi:hypothetical protein
MSPVSPKYAHRKRLLFSRLACTLALLATTGLNAIPHIEQEPRLELRAIVVDRDGHYFRIHDQDLEHTWGLKIGESTPRWTIISYDPERQALKIRLGDKTIVLFPGTPTTPQSLAPDTEDAAASTEKPNADLRPAMSFVPQGEAPPLLERTAEFSLDKKPGQLNTGSFIAPAMTNASVAPQRTSTIEPNASSTTTASGQGVMYSKVGSTKDPFLGMRRRPITDATLERVADVINPAHVE